MRERLDCALLQTTTCGHWMNEQAGVHANGRLHLRTPLPVIDTALQQSCTQLAEADMLLRSFDVCLLPVDQQSLGWVRTCLQAAHGRLHTPVIAIVHDLRAAAINDLFLLGLTDFIRHPFCHDELRVRVQRLLFHSRQSSIGTGQIDKRNGVAEAPVAYANTTNGSLPDSVTDDVYYRLFTQTGVQFDTLAAAAISESIHNKKSFRAVKGKIVEHFERSYICAALSRHSGNVAMAARTAQKHRRAFWAQMRKYEIEAEPYRSAKPYNPPDG